MGTLAHNFNEMQSKLEREETELKLAHRRATDIYNLTPSMLFSLDTDNCITAVSDYWLIATGYARTDVIGRNFTDFVAEHWHETYRAQRSRNRDSAARLRRHGEIHHAGRPDHGRADPRDDERSSDGASLALRHDRRHRTQAGRRAATMRQAITDHLTGLLNRQGFETALDDARSQRGGSAQTQLACLFVDLDRFKWINDNFGHAAGDEVLRQVVARIRTHACAPDDTMSRLGGDEFAILCQCRGRREALAIEIGDRIARSLSSRSFRRRRSRSAPASASPLSATMPQTPPNCC